MQTNRLSKILPALVLAGALTGTARALVISYAYDAAGRLTGANYGGASNTSHTYDANGNLLARTNTVNRFIPLLGRYTGLVTGGTPTVLNTGLITLAVASNGAFSGTLRLGGTTYQLKGTFDANGAATLNLTRKNPPATLTLDLQLDLDGPAQITGTLSSGETATLVAMLSPFGKKTPAPGGLAGAYTALFQPAQTGTAIPQGSGFATVTVTTAGAVKLAGVLADGAKVSQGVTLSGENKWPLFAGLYKNGGFVSGIVTFDRMPGVSDCAGALEWLKPATAGPVLPAAFSTTLDFIGSRYTAPAKGARALDLPATAPNGAFMAADGGITDFGKNFTLDASNRFTIASAAPQNLTLKLTPKSGLISGTFLDAGKTRKLQGVLFEEQNDGAGFFLGTTGGGAFTLGPLP